jgi:hypothetical protein
MTHELARIRYKAFKSDGGTTSLLFFALPSPHNRVRQRPNILPSTFDNARIDKMYPTVPRGNRRAASSWILDFVLPRRVLRCHFVGPASVSFNSLSSSLWAPFYCGSTKDKSLRNCIEHFANDSLQMFLFLALLLPLE